MAVLTFALNVSAHVAELLLTISIGMLIYLALSYLVFGFFALTDRAAEKKRRGDAE